MKVIEVTYDSFYLTKNRNYSKNKMTLEKLINKMTDPFKILNLFLFSWINIIFAVSKMYKTIEMKVRMIKKV